MIQRLQARRSEAGFTLVELLIVIVVIGILAAIVIFGVGTFRDDADAAKTTANCKTYGVAAEAYKAKTGSYPSNTDSLGGYLKAPLPSPAIAFTNGVAAGC